MKHDYEPVEPSLSRILCQAALASVFLVVLPNAMSAQLAVSEVCTSASTACVGPGNKPAIRRGATETIKIKGPFVNHTLISGVSTGNSNVTISKVVGSACGTTGCLDMTLTVKSAHPLSIRLVPIFIRNAFGSTAFNAFIVRKGEVTLVRQNPDPAIWGQRVTMTLAGNDIGNTRAAVPGNGVYNHVEADAGFGFDSTTFDVVAGGTQTSNSIGITLGDDDVSGIAGNYRFTTARRTVEYRPATAAASCVSTPGIGAPSLQSPSNTQVFVGSALDPLNTSVALRWGGPQGAFKATEKFIVELGRAGAAMAASTTGEGILVKNVSLPRGYTYQWRVKAWNCGLAAPFSATWQFTLQ